MSMAATPDKKTVVRELVELGKQKGQLTNQDILDAIGEIDFDPEQLEKLYDSLAQLGIEIVEDSGDIKIDDIDLGFDEGKDGDSHAQIAETGSVIVNRTALLTLFLVQSGSRSNHRGLALMNGCRKKMRISLLCVSMAQYLMVHTVMEYGSVWMVIFMIYTKVIRFILQ